MIIEQHYDDEVLIGLLNEAEEDKHVPVCGTCTGTLESYRHLSAALHDDSVWDERELPETPAPQTTNFLRSFAERTKAEDAAAASIVPKLLANPSLLEEHPEWRTAGVVRGLLKVVDEKNFSEPKVAADVAALAVRVAESLESGPYPFDAVTKLRATSWRERAYALYYIGSYKESIKALDQTDDLLRACVVSEYDGARAQLIRAQVYVECERFLDAADLADSAAQVFVRFGDIKREATARSTRARILLNSRRVAEAFDMYHRLAHDARIDDAARAFAFHNAAICLKELSQLDRSKSMFVEAIRGFERLGIVTMRARARWHFATVLAAEKKFEQAFALFSEVRTEFEDLGMPQDVALLAIDSAEVLLAVDRREQVVQLCHEAMEYFANAGLAYTQGALTALAYVKEATETGTLTPVALGKVRAYFEILPRRPELLFAYSA